MEDEVIIASFDVVVFMFFLKKVSTYRVRS